MMKDFEEAVQRIAKAWCAVAYAVEIKDTLRRRGIKNDYPDLHSYSNKVKNAEELVSVTIRNQSMWSKNEPKVIEAGKEAVKIAKAMSELNAAYPEIVREVDAARRNRARRSQSDGHWHATKHSQKWVFYGRYNDRRTTKHYFGEEAC